MKRARSGSPNDSNSHDKRNLYLMLGGLVAGAIVGWWTWLRSVRKY